MKAFDRRPVGVTDADYSWHHGTSLKTAARILRRETKQRTRYATGSMKSLEGLYIAADDEIATYHAEASGGIPTVFHIRGIPRTRLELDEDEVVHRSRKPTWMAALPPAHRRNVELLTWESDRRHQIGEVEDRRLRALRASGVEPQELARVLGPLPLVVETVRVDRGRFGRLRWVDVFARWDANDQRRGRAIVDPHPCRGWRYPDTKHLEGDWARFAPGSLIHARLEPRSTKRLIRRVTLCPSLPRLPAPSEEALTPRVMFSQFDAASGVLALGEWTMEPGHPRVVRGADAKRYIPVGTDKIEVPSRAPRFVFYTNVYPTTGYVPTESEVFDARQTGEVWALRPTPVRLVGGLSPLESTLMQAEVRAFMTQANEDGLEVAVADWSLGDVNPDDYEHLGDWNRVQFWAVPAHDYAVSIVDHYLRRRLLR